ncbi:MAG: hypothetical protein ACYTHJ_09930 [Planctomycetota bacterium]|jgi:hypothetical protein
MKTLKSEVPALRRLATGLLFVILLSYLTDQGRLRAADPGRDEAGPVGVHPEKSARPRLAQAQIAQAKPTPIELSARLHRWSIVHDGIRSRLALPQLPSSWLNEFDGSREELVEVVLAHHLRMKMDRPDDLVVHERTIGTLELKQFLLAMIERAGELLLADGGSVEGLRYLSAARALALDVGSGANMSQKSRSLFLCRRTLEAVRNAVDAHQRMSPALARWVRDDPRLIDMRVALVLGRLKISQWVELHSIEQEDGNLIVDPDWAYEFTGGKVSRDTLLSLDETLGLTGEIFTEYEDCLRAPIDEVKARLRAGIKWWSAQPAWRLAQRLVPSMVKGLVWRIETEKLQAKLKDLATDVLELEEG